MLLLVMAFEATELDPLDLEPEQEDGAAEERWLVMMAPGEVKAVTLEQLDDFFRCEIIDASTRVCGPDMDGWEPLGVVAGIEGGARDAPPPPPPPAAVPSRPPANLHESTVTTVAPASYVATVQSTRPGIPPAPKLNVTHPPVEVALPWGPPPASVVPASAPPVAPAPVEATDIRKITTMPPRAQIPETLRPIAGDIPIPSRPASEGGGMWIVALAAVAGLSLVLYRNDVLRSAAVGMGQETTYSQVEAALGAPGFGTQRSVSELREVFEKARQGDRERPSFTSSSSRSTDSAADAEESEDVADAEPSASKPGASKSKSLGAAAAKTEPPAPRSKRSAPKRSHRKSRPARRAPRREVTAAPPPPKKAPKGHEFDPLNGNL